jgi:hypothetical protein
MVYGGAAPMPAPVTRTQLYLFCSLIKPQLYCAGTKQMPSASSFARTAWRIYCAGFKNCFEEAALRAVLAPLRQ